MDNNRIPSLDELSKGYNTPSKNSSGLPTFDETMFGRRTEQRAPQEQSKESESGWEVDMPNDIENVGTELTTAPTTNPKRPRALSIGYNPNSKTLIVVFRDNTWWQYNNVPSDLWLGLRNSASTGKYLRAEGLDTWPDMGPADINALSEGVKAQFSSVAQSASDIQNSETVLQKTLKGKESLQSFSAEDLFRDYL
jgi:hypothetical protein